MANSISAELTALREEVAALRAEVREVLELARPVELEAELEGVTDSTEPLPPADPEDEEETGVQLVDGQLVDVPKKTKGK